MAEVVDVCLVGAGVACLYAARELLKRDPALRVLLLERERRVGGRVWASTFAGVPGLPRGAGVGRVGTDRRLLALLDELGLPYRTVPHVASHLAWAPPQIDVAACVRRLRAARPAAGRDTFRAYATRVLGGPEAYAAFKTAAGFSDFDRADALDTVLDYHLQDLHTDGARIALVPWQALLRALVKGLPPGSVRTRCAVERLERRRDGRWDVHASDGVVTAARVVVGGTASTLRALFPRVKEYEAVLAQPFVRVYAQATGAPPLPPGMTAVPGDLQKVAHMAADVYLLAYSDNESAGRVAALRPTELESLARETLRAPRLRIKRTLRAWWPEGTHCFAPLDVAHFRDRDAFLRRAQRPAPGVAVVGEMLSRKQGWTEGALESVAAALATADWR
jgi:phytoene dehydrogenase-like protein